MAHTQLILISGFLGSGKTTLLHNLFTLYADRRIAVIVNEFGKRGVDGAVLAESGVHVEEISNGSIFCVCRSDLFLDTLVQALQTKVDIVLVETSGLSDPTGMAQILHQVTEHAGESYDFYGTICVAESARLLKLIGNVPAIKQQIVSAGMVLLNKMDVSAPETVAETTALINELNPHAEIYQTTNAFVERAWLDKLPAAQKLVKGGITRNTLGVKSLLVQVENRPAYALFQQWLAAISPEVYRIKGFVTLAEGVFLADCAGPQVALRKAAGEGSYVVILTGGGDKTVKLLAEAHQRILGTEIVFE